MTERVIRYPGARAGANRPRERVITMSRARRLASTVVAAALAVTGLAACNRSPSVAVYFGDQGVVTEAEVQRIWDDTSAKLTKDNEGKLVMPISRQTIMTLELYVAALRELGKDKGFTGTPVSAADLAPSFTMQPDAAFITLVGEYQGWMNAAQQSQPVGSISEPDLREVYDRIKTAGYPETYETFAGQGEQLAQAGLGSAISLRNALRAEIADLHVRFNPRYSAPTMVLAQYPNTQVTVVDVAFGPGASAPVIDLR